MATLDLVGIPFPIQHPLFAQDDRVVKLVKEICDLVEMEADIDETICAINEIESLRNLLANSPTLHWSGGLPTQERVGESLFTYAVMNYGNVYKTSIGRRSLKGEARDIHSEDNQVRHESVIRLRDKYVAHREYQANKHTLFVSDTPEGQEINLGGQRHRNIASRSVELVALVKEAAEVTKRYIATMISTRCKDLLLGLSSVQKHVIEAGSLGDRYFEYQLPDSWVLRASVAP